MPDRAHCARHSLRQRVGGGEVVVEWEVVVVVGCSVVVVRGAVVDVDDGRVWVVEVGCVVVVVVTNRRGAVLTARRDVVLVVFPACELGNSVDSWLLLPSDGCSRPAGPWPNTWSRFSVARTTASR